MRTPALLLLAALPFAGCSQEAAPAALPPAGLAGGAHGGAVGGAAAPHVPFGAQGGHPAVAHGAVGQNEAQPGAQAQGEPRAHPPMNTVPSPHGATGEAAASSQPAAPTIIPGGGAAHVAGAADLAGVVAEAHHVKEYTYLRVKEANGNESWAAILKDETVGVGAQVSFAKDIWMTDFQSASMGRTFDRILFGRLLSK